MVEFKEDVSERVVDEIGYDDAQRSDDGGEDQGWIQRDFGVNMGVHQGSVLRTMFLPLSWMQ